MTQTELRQVIDMIRAPLAVADKSGMVLAENRAWASVRQMLGEQATSIQQLVRKAVESGSEQTCKSGGLKLLAAPLRGDYVILQLPGESLEALRKQMEDTMQTNSS